MAESIQEDGEEKKSSKKMIIIVSVVVLLLVGGGAGYYFMAGDNIIDDGETIEEIKDEEDEEDEGSLEEIYYELNQPLIVNFPKGSGASLIQVSVTLLGKGEETINALKKHEPMIRNNLLMSISANEAKDLMTRKGKEELRSKMLKEVGKVMERMTGKNKVMNIFFTTFVMQ